MWFVGTFFSMQRGQANKFMLGISFAQLSYQGAQANEGAGCMPEIRISTSFIGACAFFSLALLGCSSADNEMAGGNLKAVNHTLGAINWFEVNGYRAHGGGGASCCIILPIKWRPGLKAHIEWEFDPDPFAPSPPLGTDEFRAFMVKHEANYRRHSATVDIPEWPGTEGCGLKVHFLVCNQIKVTTSCWGYGSPNNPIKEPLRMKEPAVCPK